MYLIYLFSVLKYKYLTFLIVIDFDFLIATLGSLWMVEADFEILLDVCGSLYHVGAYPNLHIPV